MSVYQNEPPIGGGPIGGPSEPPPPPPADSPSSAPIGSRRVETRRRGVSTRLLTALGAALINGSCRGSACYSQEGHNPWMPIVVLILAVVGLIVWICWPERGAACDRCGSRRAYTLWRGELLCAICVEAILDERPAPKEGQL